ncbi:MAG: putative transcriptional regulator [Fibrobacteres bacterium]|nr:putative transcriptional regulator [Fibrobacterota bacterium]
MIRNTLLPQSLRKKAVKGPFRASEAEALGVSRTALVRWVEQGMLLRISRGLYSLPGVPISGKESFLEVAIKAPKAVFCLLTALEVHGVSTQLHPSIWIAIEQGDWKPRGMSMDLRVVRFSGKAFREGIEIQPVNGITVRVYSLAKTIADCFRYRNKIGMEVAVEALKEGLRSKKAAPTDIRRFAELRGVSKVLGPYLEAFLG